MELYHERQSRQMCLVHSLNALLQKKHFTSQSLDEICYGLDDRTWLNPHKSWLGLGNYDVNVLMLALESVGYEVVWFDARSSVDNIDFQGATGLIFNIPSRSYIPFMNGRHWFTVLKQSDGSFVNLDSKLQKPEVITDIRNFSRIVLSADNENNQVLVIKKKMSTEGVQSTNQ